MLKTKILGTGLSGLVGSRIIELLNNKYDFEEISRSKGVDIVNKDKVFEAIKKTEANTILHLAAFTNVDEAELEKEKKEESMIWKINVFGTKNIVDACRQFSKKLLYISTDMVFNGYQSFGSKYNEADLPDPLNFYALTKYEAEKKVLNLDNFLILRIAYPFRSKFEIKKDYVRIFKTLLEEKKSISAVTDHYFTPTFLDDLIYAIDLLISKNQNGIFHVVGDSSVSPFTVANILAKKFGLDKNLILPTTREEYFKGKAVRGFNLSLNNAKIKQLGLNLHSLDEGLDLIKENL